MSIPPQICYFHPLTHIKNLRQEPLTLVIRYLNFYSLVSFPQAKRVGNPSGKIPDKPE